MNNLLKKIEFRYLFDKNNNLVINAICLFNKIFDDSGLRFRIFSKKTFYEPEKEERDPIFLNSDTSFEIKKSYSFMIKKFSFIIRDFDDIEYIKIGFVKENFYWFDKNIYEIKINYLEKKIYAKIILDKIYLKLLKRDCDKSGFESFSELLFSKRMQIKDIYNVILNSEEYLSNSKTDYNYSSFEDIDTIIECPANRCDGYGNSAHYFCENLSLKSKIRIVPTVLTKDISDEFSKLIIKKCDYKKFNPKNYLFFNIPNSSPSIIDSDIKKYILTMFESTKIPSSWPSIINSQFDNLIVPSEFCKSIFKNNGVTIKTDVVTLGVNDSSLSNPHRA